MERGPNHTLGCHGDKTEKEGFFFLSLMVSLSLSCFFLIHGAFEMEMAFAVLPSLVYRLGMVIPLVFLFFFLNPPPPHGFIIIIEDTANRR